MAKYRLGLSKSNSLLTRTYQENSGLIVVTGTGSTGWPSAFTPFPRTSKFFEFTTILPFKKTALDRGEGDYFNIQYKGHEGKIEVDTIEYEFPRYSTLEIKISENPLKIIIPKKD
jgi:hypothetical protein